MSDTPHSIVPDHPMAPEHLPFFITAPGQPDVLFNGMVIFVLLLFVILGIVYFHLHSVPDRMAHKANNAQLQLIGILTLIALFTHNNIYWVAAIILAAINLPDLITPITSIARSLRRMSGRDGEEEDFGEDERRVSDAMGELRDTMREAEPYAKAEGRTGA